MYGFSIVISIDSLIIKKECKRVQTPCWTPPGTLNVTAITDLAWNGGLLAKLQLITLAERLELEYIFILGQVIGQNMYLSNYLFSNRASLHGNHSKA